jgi:hypothetical protein
MCFDNGTKAAPFPSVGLGPQASIGEARSIEDVCQRERLRAAECAKTAQCDTANSRPLTTVYRDLRQRRTELETQRARINRQLDLVNALLSVFED